MEFILPEENNEFKLATKGSDFFCALQDIKDQIREHDKYDLPIEECLDRIKEIVYDANLDEIE